MIINDLSVIGAIKIGSEKKNKGNKTFEQKKGNEKSRQYK